MTVYFEDFKEIVSRLESDFKRSEEYLDSLRLVDSSLTEFICENEYNNILYFQNDFVIRKFLTDELVDWINWYLYEVPLMKTTTSNCVVNGVNYLVNDFNSFMDFAQHALCLPMRPNISAHENDED